MLVGDSITAGYFPYVASIAEDQAYASLLATSKAVDNPDLIHEMAYAFRHGNNSYGVIHFNNGLHGWHVSQEVYANKLEEAVIWLKEHAPAAKIILALSTSVWVKGQPAAPDQEKDRIIRFRNESVLHIAQRYQCEVNDLYTAMNGRPEYRTDDGYHFHETGKKEQGKIVAAIILSKL